VYGVHLTLKKLRKPKNLKIFFQNLGFYSSAPTPALTEI